MRPDNEELDDLMREARVTGLKIVALLMALVTLGFALAQSVDAATPAEDNRAYCDGEWCMVRQKALVQLAEGANRLADKVKELESMCGWQK